MQWLRCVSVNDFIEAPILAPEEHAPQSCDLAVMLTGGGARAAYQVGLLVGLARHFPHLRFQVITGVSAGAINASYLAAAEGSLREKAEKLADMWCALQCEHIFRFDIHRLLPFRSALASIFPKQRWRRYGGMLDTTPLRRLLRRVLNARDHGAIDGIKRNLRLGELKAVALTTLDYSTGQTVRWVQGRDVDVFEGPNRRSVPAELTLDHVMASASLPFVFPAVNIGGEWHGDGGIRLAAPLSAAVHLGATRILAMSTGYQRTPEEADRPVVHGYPPAGQIISQLVNAVFLDVIDEDVARLERLNEMIKKIPKADRNGFRPIDLCVLRPSQDLGVLAAEYERYLPTRIKIMTRALGAKETESPDFVSLLAFTPRYMERLLDLGVRDVEQRLDDLRAFFSEDARHGLTAV